MDKELKGALYQIIDQLNERKNTSTMFYSTHLNKRYPFYDRNGRTCKIQSANDDIIRQNIQTNLNYIKNNVIVLLEAQKNTKSKNPKVVKTNMQT